MADRDILEVLDEGYAEAITRPNREIVIDADVLYAVTKEIRRLRIGSNYVVDRDVKPSCVWFRDGRRVSIIGSPGDHYLDVQTPPIMRLQCRPKGMR